MEQNCFQEVQNYTFWLVLEKAYREKNVISPCILSRRLNDIELCLFITRNTLFHCFNKLEETKDFYNMIFMKHSSFTHTIRCVGANT